MRVCLKILFLLFFVNIVYAQETGNDFDDDYWYDFGMAEGITIYAERPKEFDSESMEAYVLNQLNGSASDRKQLIETDFLEEAGFRRSGTARYRRTRASEKTSSILYGIGHALSFGIIPQRPFLEIEYDKLPKGQYYNFVSIIGTSKFKDISPEVLILLEAEYMLQIWFCNGIIIQDNINYYTEENITKFEALIFKLPDYPESMGQAKSHYIAELQKIKAALERHRNPSENNQRALENLREYFYTQIN